MTIEPPALPPTAPTPPAAVPALPRWSSTVLLGERREALIDHRGEQYRLRLTAAGKLILTK
ncbi:hemin uptake protein HemP [Variovorax sp. YR752]|uniref:hemin uptake protein HemP n=1 Tax=Variovorax sp. YR752 TaxID=1884383 RepID=UPI0031381305